MTNANSQPVLIVDGAGKFTALDSKVWKDTLPPGTVIVLAIFTDGTKRLMKLSSHVPDDSYFIYLGYCDPNETTFCGPEDKIFTCGAFNDRYSQLGICWDDLNQVSRSEYPMGKEIFLH